MIYQCPACETDCEFEDDAAGKIVECPNCEHMFRAEVEDNEFHCPKCNVSLDEGTNVCMACGFNLVDGEYLRTVVTPEQDELSGPMKALNVVADLLPGLFRPFVLVAAIVCCVVGVAITLMGMVLLSMKVVFSGMAVAAFGLITYAQGIALLLCGSFEILSKASIDFESKHWYLFCLLVFGPALAVILGIIYGSPATAN